MNFHQSSPFQVLPVSFFLVCTRVNLWPNDTLLYARPNILMGIRPYYELLFLVDNSIHWCSVSPSVSSVHDRRERIFQKDAYLYLTRHDIVTETNWLSDRKMIHVTCALKITWYVPSMYHSILTTIQQLEIKLSISSEKY